MAANVIDSYLVSLGFNIDQPELNKFDATLKGVAANVHLRAGNMLHDIVKWQGAAMGAFAAVGTAVIGMLDHVADADQSYRLMAMHMFVSKDAARSLTMATDALGVSLADAIWDPELRARFDKLLDNQKRVAAAFGVDADDSMRRMRDYKFQYQQFTQTVEIGARMLAIQLFKALTGGSDDPLKKLQEWNDWILDNLPKISGWLTTNMLPVWRDFKDVAKESWQVIKEIGVAFANVIGLLTGDTSIQGTEFSFKKVAKAIGEAVHMIAEFIKGVLHAEEIVLHLVSAAALLAKGNYKAAMVELGMAGKAMTPAAGAVIGGGVMAAGGGVAGAAVGAMTGPAAPIAIPVLSALGTFLGGGIGAGFGYLAGKFSSVPGSGGTEGPGGTAAAGAGGGGGGLETLAKAIGFAEGFGIAGSKPTRNHNQGDLTDGSGNIRSFDTDDAGHQALIAQLQLIASGKSRAYGKNPDITLEELSKTYTATDQSAWLANVIKSSGYSKDTKLSDIANGSAPTIGSITVNVASTNATPADIHRAVATGAHQAIKDHQERNMAEAQGPYAGAY